MKIKKKKQLFTYNNINKNLDILKNNSSKKFLENIELTINTNKINNKIININTSCLLPNKIGKLFSLAVFCNSNNYELMKNNNIEYFDFDIIKNIINNKKKKIDILLLYNNDIDINIIKKLVKKNNKYNIPNKLCNTIIYNINEINEFKYGKRIIYKNNIYGIINTIIGKVNFSNEILIENIKYFIEDLKNKINNLNYIKKIYISSTMGKSFILE